MVCVSGSTVKCHCHTEMKVSRADGRLRVGGAGVCVWWGGGGGVYRYITVRKDGRMCVRSKQDV